MGYEQPIQIDLFGSSSANATSGADGRRSAAATHQPLHPAPLDDAGMVGQLEATGRYRILCNLEPRPVAEHLWPLPDRQPDVWPRLGVVLDTETSGLDHATHEVIELGMVAFTYDEAGVRDVVGVFSALQEPVGPISPEITRITGITDAMVSGQRIDLAAVERFIEPVDLVIAHNAGFDRPFCEKLSSGFDTKPWACSVSEVDWVGLGFEGTKLGYLIGQCGYFHNGHRAVEDCHALLEVLAHLSRTDAIPPFRQLLASSQQARLRIHAFGAPLQAKDMLKARGYRWSDGTGGKPKCWWREVEEDVFDEEARFLEEDIYAGGSNAHVERLTACERFKA